jgi:YidC/Oxa1 family membrane protein insertase
VGIWDTFFINPMINGLIVLEQILFDSFGLAIIVFTVLVRLATLPLTLRQVRASRKMQAVTPQVQEIQKKYKDPKRRQQETMKLYRETGVNPIGCLGPMIIQLPIFFALYRVLNLTVAGTPERTAELSHRLYSWSFIQDAIPFSTHFLGIDLGRRDVPILMFILVWVTTWLQTKMSFNQQSQATMTAQQRQTNNMMLWWMPTLFAWFTFSVPSGLSMYWVVTNVIGIAMNWFVYGWNKRPLRELFLSPPSQDGAAARRSRPSQASAAGQAAALSDGNATKAARGTPNGRRAGDKRRGRVVVGGRDTPARTIKRSPAGRGAAEKRNPNGKGGDQRKDGG